MRTWGIFSSSGYDQSVPSPLRNRSTPQARGAAVYSKPALSHADLVARLRSRGLSIPEEDRAVRYVRHIGYYRLSPYTIPFQLRASDHQFVAGASFDDVLDLYVFDRHLRLLVLDGLERIEVAVRAGLTDTLSLGRGGPHWYLDGGLFTRADDHLQLLADLRSACDEQLRRAPEPAGDQVVFPSALGHYLTHYGQPDLPPSWVMVERLTLGQLTRLLSNLRDRSQRTALAADLGIKEPLLTSWLRTYVRVRNVCAHHGRLWNVGLGVYPRLPESPDVAWLKDRSVLDPDRAKRLYPVLVSIQTILSTISPHSSWASRLVTLLEQHPDVPLRGMGMFEGWHQDAFWASAIDAGESGHAQSAAPGSAQPPQEDG